MDRGRLNQFALPRKNCHEIREVLEQLIDKNLDVPIVVEGIKDERALRDVGCIGSILVFNRGESVTQFCESLHRAGVRDVILLTDWDRHGAFLAERLAEALDSLEIKHNNDLRKRLAFYCKKYIMDVESLGGLLESIMVEHIEKPGLGGMEEEKELVVRHLEDFR